MKKVLYVLGWIFGIAAILGGFKNLFSNVLQSVYYFSFAVIVFPPANHLIAKTPHAKLVKVIIVGIFVLTIVLDALRTYGILNF